MVHGTEKHMRNAKPLLVMKSFWCWMLLCIVINWYSLYQCADLEILSFAFTILNQECRYKSEAWCVLGYIPDLEMKSIAYKQNNIWVQKAKEGLVKIIIPV